MTGETSIGKLIKKAVREQEEYHYRFGQALFNALSERYPDLAEAIRGTEYDPFYDDNQIGNFITWVSKELS